MSQGAFFVVQAVFWCVVIAGWVRVARLHTTALQLREWLSRASLGCGSLARFVYNGDDGLRTGWPTKTIRRMGVALPAFDRDFQPFRRLTRSLRQGRTPSRRPLNLTLHLADRNC